MRLMLAAVAAIALFPGTATSQAPALTMEWLTIAQPHATCMHRAESAIQRSGYRVTDRASYTVFARPFSDDYTFAIRCITDKSMVLLVCAGPNLRRCDDHLDRIKAAYGSR